MISSLVLIVITILVLDSVVSASEAAIFSVPINKVRRLAEKKRNARVLLSLKESMEGPIVTLISLSNLITIIGSVVAGIVAAKTFGEQWVGAFATVLTFLIMIIAEIIPKRLGERYSLKVALIMAPPIKATAILFKPITWFIEKVTQPFNGKKEPSVSREEISFLADLGRKEGVIDEYESQIIRRVFRLSNVTAEDMMTPRPFVLTLDGNRTIKNAQQDIQRAAHSRIPVYEDSKEKIIGMVHQRDLLKALAADKHSNLIKHYCQKPLVVSFSRVGDDLLKDFLQAKTHLAIVVNKKDKMIGIVGLEDVLEELVGEIVDEKDIRPEFIKRISRNEVLAHGQTHLTDLNRFFNINIESKKTLNGYLLEKLKHRPLPGDKVKDGKVTFYVGDVGPHTIEKVKVIKKN